MTQTQEPTPAVTRWQAYPAYKASGIAWLGEIPAHWEVKRLRHICQLNPSKLDIASMLLDTEISFLPMECIGEDGTLALEETRLLGQVLQGYTHFRNGDIVVAKITPCFENGKGAICGGLIHGVGFGTTELHVLRPKKLYDAKFIFYLTRTPTFRMLGTASMYGSAGQKRVPENFISDFYSCFPPLPEQQAIAAFLDRETERINTLIADKERLIALLQEQRAAIISRAVTRGLEATVSLKASGVAWLGEIPAHWEVKRIKYLASILRGRFSHRPRNDPKFYEGPYPFIQTGDVAAANKYITGYQQTLNEDGFAVSKQFPSGTLVMTIAANIGDLAILQFPACFPDSIVGFVPRPFVNLEYLYYNLSSMKHEMLRTATINTQFNLNIERIGSLFTAHPPLPEQQAIAAYLDEETAKIDALIATIQVGIKKVQEYGAALVSAAVTGKIDVRDVQV